MKTLELKLKKEVIIIENEFENKKSNATQEKRVINLFFIRKNLRFKNNYFKTH